MEEFKGPAALALFAGLVGVGISYLESQYSKEERSKTSYLKIFLLIVVIVIGTLKINSIINNTSVEANIKPNLGKEILTGNPEF